ncbi:MAG: LytTR family DNA-binding domain-containing protein [Eggerthellaceae bacterium]|nr:LytTR family DNA-binding domain-containing protein [Eggerthellaceae bacterium]
MLNVVIVENEREQALALERMIGEHPQAGVFSVSHLDGAEALRSRVARGLSEPRIDMLFMDICLDDADGVELVKELFPTSGLTQVIYVTGHPEYCTRVYQSSHVYFLLKPVAQADLFDAIDKALANLDNESRRPLAVSVGGNVMRISPDDIDFVESDRRKVRIHMADAVVETYGSLARMASMLPPEFIQCHKSFLVNMDRVAELQPEDAVLLSGERVPVSQKRRKFVKESLLEHLRAGL